MTSKKTIIIIVSVILSLVILGGIATGILLSKKLKKYKTYSIVSEQNLMDYYDPRLIFTLFTDRGKAPHTEDEISTHTLYNQDHSFVRQLKLYAIKKYYDENFNGKNYEAYTYAYDLPKELSEGLYTGLKLELTLKNGNKVRYRVGKMSISRPKTLPYGKHEAFPIDYFTSYSLKTASTVYEKGSKKPIADDLPYRFYKVVFSYGFAEQKPCEILEISYKVDKEGTPVPAKFVQKDDMAIIDIEDEKFELFTIYLRVKVKRDGQIGYQEFTQNLLTADRYRLLNNAQDLIYEPIVTNN